MKWTPKSCSIDACSSSMPRPTSSSSARARRRVSRMGGVLILLSFDGMVRVPSRLLLRCGAENPAVRRPRGSLMSAQCVADDVAQRCTVLLLGLALSVQDHVGIDVHLHAPSARLAVVAASLQEVLDDVAQHL